MEHIINEANSIRSQLPNHIAMLQALEDKLEVAKAKEDKDRDDKAAIKEMEAQVEAMQHEARVSENLAVILENAVMGRFGTIKGMLG
jgi:hypothetical protein